MKLMTALLMEVFGIMEFKEQVDALKASVVTLTDVVNNEAVELKAKFDAFAAKLLELGGFDLTAEIDAINASIEKIAAFSDLDMPVVEPVVGEPQV